MLPIVSGYFIPLSIYNFFKDRIEEGLWYKFDPWANSSDCLSEKCSNGIKERERKENCLTSNLQA